MSKIRDIAEDFRERHIFNNNVPVEIERVVEATLGINVIPIESLQKDCDMDGFISNDLSIIYVDKDHYIDERFYKRVRFTIAHEIGHLVLHREIIDTVMFSSEDEWKLFRMNLQDESLSWFETQASEFAGRLLVPLDPLVVAFRESRNEILKKNIAWNADKIEDEEMFTLTASIIAPKFDVSTGVIERRLRKENIMSLIS